MKYTIKDVAEKSGVSIATVSRVINGSGAVSEKSKRKVLDAIKETDFKPSQIARNLVMKKTNTIGVIVPTISNQFTGEILNGIEEISRSFGYDIMICSTGGESQLENRYLDMFESRQVEGIIFMAWKLQPSTVEKINAVKLPVVVVNRNTNSLKVPVVSIDNFKAAHEMTTYLIKKGHSKIAFFRNSIDLDACGVDQFSGYERALAENDIKLDRTLVKYGEFSAENSYRLAKTMMEGGQEATAIFATSDVMAVGAANAYKDAGYKIPRDISIVGFNDVSFASLYRPALTVIRQPLHAMGAVAVKMIAKWDHYEGDTQDRAVILPHKLIERDSSSLLL